MPARGGVDYDQIVGCGAAGLALELGELPDLADRQQLAHAGRRHRERLKELARTQHVTDRSDLDPQVLVHRVLGIDRDREQARCQLVLDKGRPGVVRERPVNPILGGELDDDRPQAGARGEHAERDRDRRLAHATLAGDEDEALVEEAGHWRG